MNEPPAAERRHGGLTADGGRKRGAWEGLPCFFGQQGEQASAPRCRPGSAEFRLRSRSMTCDTRSLPSGVFHPKPGFEELVVEISTCGQRSRCCGFGNPRSFCRRVSRRLHLAAALSWVEGWRVKGGFSRGVWTSLPLHPFTRVRGQQVGVSQTRRRRLTVDFLHPDPTP